jgi:hypothetical protein
MKKVLLLLMCIQSLDYQAVYAVDQIVQQDDSNNSDDEAEDGGWLYRNLPSHIRSAVDTAAYCINKTTEWYCWTKQQGKIYWHTAQHTKQWVEKHPIKACILAFSIGGIYTRNRYAALTISLAAFEGYKRYLIQQRYIGQVEAQANALSQERDNGDIFSDAAIKCDQCYNPSILAITCSGCQRSYCQECAQEFKQNKQYCCPYCSTFISTILRTYAKSHTSKNYTLKGQLTQSHLHDLQRICRNARVFEENSSYPD